jgi:hypothetical protein
VSRADEGGSCVRQRAAGMQEARPPTAGPCAPDTAQARAHARCPLRLVRAWAPRRDVAAVVVNLIDDLLEGGQLGKALEVIVRPDVLHQHGVEVHVAHCRILVARQHIRQLLALLAFPSKGLRRVLAVGVGQTVVVAPARIAVPHHRLRKGAGGGSRGCGGAVGALTSGPRA